MTRLLLHLAILAVLLLATRPVLAQDAGDVTAIIRDRAAAHGVSGSWLVAVARCETGGTFDPYAVGRQGELGLFQLHPRGLLLDFYARGYTEPFSAWQSADYAASAFARGLAFHWSCS